MSKMSAFNLACTFVDAAGNKDQNLKLLETIFKYGPSMLCADNLGRTPLHLAARSGNETAVRFILENCEDTSILSLRTIGGETPLMKAAEQGSLENIKLLL